MLIAITLEWLIAIVGIPQPGGIMQISAVHAFVGIPNPAVAFLADGARRMSDIRYLIRIQECGRY